MEAPQTNSIPPELQKEQKDPNEKPSKATRTKVIKTPGSKIERIAQACDRCRLKKTKCDGKRPQCSQCELVGFECKVSDKLSRLSYPRGYTETLEQRVRELETENKKLLALLDLRKTSPDATSIDDHNKSLSPESSSICGATQRLSSNNLSLLNKQTSAIAETTHFDILDHTKHIHSGPGCCANYPHSVHETPVSIAGSVDLEQSDDQDSLYSFNDSDSLNPYSGSNHHLHHPNGFYNVSFEQNQAPGLNAALAIARMNNLRNSNSSSNNSKFQLANLVAMSIPRSTEEMLFIPSLLSKIGETHGLSSKACFLTANTIASLKQIPKVNTDNLNGVNFNSLNFKNITVAESNLFFNSLKLPSKIQLDQLITIYFQEWGIVVPMIDKNEFLNQYGQFSKSMENNFNDNLMMKNERFGLLLIIMCQLALISLRNNNINGTNKLNEQDLHLINYYDSLIHKLIQTSLTEICSIQSLQILTLTLYYSLNTGDVITTYHLRGKVITMAQQLRLHRCPSAVLGTNGSTVSKFQQGERRILFWCIYSLDIFASLQLGVPRLLKDYEIECALPIGIDSEIEDESNNFIIVNNSKISLIGKVFKFSLSIMRYSKVLGNILDSIFKRHSSTQGKISNHELILIHENLLDSWRRDLPSNYQFQIDVNGGFKMEDGNETLDFKKIVLILLYYSAKMLIHLPVIANEVEKASRSSNIVIQQCSIAILKLLKSSTIHFDYQLPLPMNLPRLKTRLILLTSKGSLEYTRGGAIFQEIKKLLGNLLQDLKTENYDINSPGNLSNSCIQLLETSVELILGGGGGGGGNNSVNGVPLNGNKEVKRSSSLSKATGIQSYPLNNTRKRNISNIADPPSTPTPQPHQLHQLHQQFSQNQIKSEPTDNENQLTQMLSQINYIPPISKPQDVNLNNRIPPSNGTNAASSTSSCKRASSISTTTPTSQQQQQQYQQTPHSATQTGNSSDNFDLNFNMSDFNFNFSNDENYEFAEFGADGSLGLEPWLNNFQDSTSSRNNSIAGKSNTPPLDYNMSDQDYTPTTSFSNTNNRFNNIGSGDSIISLYSNQSRNTPTPPESLMQFQQQSQQILGGELPAQQQQQQQQQQQFLGQQQGLNVNGSRLQSKSNGVINGPSSAAAKNSHQSLFDWQNSY